MKRIFFIFLSILSLPLVLSAQYPPYLGPDYMIRVPARIQEQATVLYRKSKKEELEALKPNAADLTKYAEFLRQPETGIIRLAPDRGCAENSKVINASDDCLKYTMPGAGASYSFRVKDYRLARLADLTFYGVGFEVTGSLSHGILTRIGDVPLENVNLQTNGLKFLVDFKPVMDYDQAKKIGAELVKGIIKNGFIYRRGLNALENTTYVLRSIAYDGAVYRAVDNFTYNELDFDKRKDVIVTFRIVRKHADGSVTLLWKKLAEKDSPKLKRKKSQARLY
jgi:hypothetical protein